MSKKFRGKKCVYCCAAISVTADHVFARELFLKSRRANLPKVPACELCNQKKSVLEHYVTTLLPFGGRHRDGKKNLKSMVPKRLYKNVTLRTSLQRDMKRVWTREKGLIVPTAALPLDWHKIEEWLVFVVKGLAWHHWKILIGAGCTFDVHALTQRGEALYQRLFIMRAAQRIPLQNLGAGTFSYEASQGIDTPEISVWTFSLYGGVTLADDETAPGQTVSKIGVMVGPNRVFEKARLAAN